jgi:CYTH domain-containing protein
LGGVGPHDEIERKYLLSALPERARGAPSVEIEQGWMPGGDPRTRLRRETSAEGVRFLRTIKQGRGLRRSEVEEDIPAAEFERLWPATEGCRVRKRRYRVSEGDLVWEVDEFRDRPLVLAEVELPAEGHPVELPAWLRPVLVREVTEESTYVNLSLAR